MQGAQVGGRDGWRHIVRWRPVIVTGGVALVMAALVAAYAVWTLAAPPGFGTLAEGAHPTLQADTGNQPTRLVIARLGVDTPVIPLGITGGAWQVPAYAAGYLMGTGTPGQPGNVAITGHVDSDGAVFRRLGDLHFGDSVQVYRGARTSYSYTVTALRVVLCLSR